MKLIHIVIIIMMTQQSQAAIRYVTPGGAGLQNGTSWAHAFSAFSLQAAINTSTNGDEVWVACGTYFTTNTTNRSISFSMRNNVGVYGSFQGNETLRSQRTLTCGPCSILSGEIGNAGFTDNSYHVVSNASLNSSAVLDGFVISGGNDNRTATILNGLGGGIYNNGGYAGNVCSPTIRNCVITNNRAVFGAGIFNSGHTGGNSNPEISNCIIHGNLAYDGGGGIDNFGLGGNASPVITNCVVYNNIAQTAGGMYCWGGNANGNSSPILLNCVFANNQATAGNAGGIIADNSNSSGGGSSGISNPTLRNCIVWGNTASLAGPQFFIKGSGLFTATYSNINLSGQTVFPNVIAGSGVGNINSNPMFVSLTDADGIDNCWMTKDDGLQVAYNSPCINSGNNVGVSANDLKFNARLANSNVEMGAYEYNTQLDLRCFLQGYYHAAGLMKPVLFNQNIAASLSEVDEVLVELHEPNSPYAIIATDSIRLQINGTGQAFFQPLQGNYYVAIKHRNTIHTWSSSAIPFGSSPGQLDFSSSSSVAYGGNQSEVESGVWALYTADMNQDENIDLLDLGILESDINNFMSGYLATDSNGDGNVDLLDVPVMEGNINGFIFAIHP